MRLPDHPFFRAGPVGVHPAFVVAAVAGTSFLFSLVPGRFVVVPGYVSVAPADGVALPAALLFGPPGAWGAALGTLLSGPFGPLSAFEALAELLFGVVGYELWQRAIPGAPLAKSVPTTPRQVGSLLLIGLLGTLGATAVVGWGGAALGQFPFFIATVPELPGVVLATLIVGGPALVVVPRLVARLEVPVTVATAGPERARSTVRLALVSVGWYIIGTGLSLGYQVYELVPPERFRAYGLGLLVLFGDDAVFGDAGANVQMLLGAVMLIAVLLLCRRT
jgi:energy-coupling factor transport system substrate-specific component